MFKPIGRSQRSATTGYVFGCSVPEPDVPLFGSFVKAPIQQAQAMAIGLIYNISVQDDLFVRPIIAAQDKMSDEDYEIYVADARRNQHVPIEVSVLTVGYQAGERYFQNLPPQPPVLLDEVRYCDEAEIMAFTEESEYFTLILASKDAPADQLLAAAIQQAVKCRPPQDRERFLQKAGRELAKLLNRDLPRLERLLRRIQP